MQAQETIDVEATETRVRGACLVSGCTCKDPVSCRIDALPSSQPWPFALARSLIGSWRRSRDGAFR
jgi:hypothetical protein